MKTENLKIAVVVPNHIVPKKEWLNALDEATLNKADVIIVDDSHDQIFKGLYAETFKNWKVYDREDQRKELGDKYARFSIFHRSSSSRNFGNYMAWKQEYDVIIGLDSDCNVPRDLVEWHIEGLNMVGHGWTNPIKIEGWFPRGYPYSERNRKVTANLGLWENVLDINAKDRKDNEPKETHHRIEFSDGSINNGEYEECNLVAESFIPFSGMNWAILREAMPGFLFLPNFNLSIKDREWKFRRHDDIWGGYIFQRFMELRNERIAYGRPIVFHDTVLDIPADIAEEEAMIAFENTFYGAVDLAMKKVTPGMYEEMMLQFYEVIKVEWAESEWQPLIDPIKVWTQLFLDIQ